MAVYQTTGHRWYKSYHDEQGSFPPHADTLTTSWGHRKKENYHQVWKEPYEEGSQQGGMEPEG